MATEKSKEDLKDENLRLKKKAKDSKEDGQRYMMRIVQTLEMESSVFGFSIMNGRYGGFELMGAPVDALAAGGLYMLALTLPQGGEHAAALADGAAGSFVATLGRGVGRRLRADAGPEERAELVQELTAQITEVQKVEAEKAVANNRGGSAAAGAHRAALGSGAPMTALSDAELRQLAGV